MKRTGEIILTTLGVISSLVGLLTISTFLFFSNTQEFRNIVQDGFIEGATEEGLAISAGEINAFLDIFLGMSWIVFATLLFGTIFGILSIYFFVGNKKPKAASIIAIIIAIGITIGTALTGFIPGLFYLIAGIIGLVRKPPIVNHAQFAETNLSSEQNNPDHLT